MTSLVDDYSNSAVIFILALFDFQNLVELFAQSPPRKEPQNVTHKSNIHSIAMEDELSPTSNQLSDGLENSSTRKRINEEIISQDEIAQIQRSPKLCKRGICDPEVTEPLNRSNCRASTSGHELKHWFDVCTFVSIIVLLYLPRWSIDEGSGIYLILNHVIVEIKF